ncbi:MAG: parallel beta-helix domain-containing protein [Candidatus Binatia bacterium]
MKWIACALACALSWAPSVTVAADCDPIDPATFACQDTIGKAATTFAKAQANAVGKCLASFQKAKITGPDAATVCRGTSLGALPTDAKTAGKITDAVAKASAMIATKCTDPQVASLQLCAGTVAGLGGTGSCFFAEHFAQVNQAIGAETGALVATTDAGLQKCQGTITKEAGKYLAARMKAVQKCLKDRNKVCGTAGALPRCLAAQAGGPKAEAKVVASLAKAKGKMDAKIQATCSDGQVAALDACADTRAGAVACLECTHGNSAEDQVAAEYTVVRQATTTTGLQAVADAAEDGDTILVEPGTYLESMTLEDAGLTVLGHKTCATGARPLIANPGSIAIGIDSCGSLQGGCSDVADHQVLQSLEVANFGQYDVHTSGADGVTYRDLVMRGPETTGGTAYGASAVLSDNVLIEDCVASGLSDAAIYVSQSTHVVVRRNEVSDSVAGIEIENSANAEVYDNTAHDNTAGILVFKLPGLGAQFSSCHDIHDNRAINNNHANYGVGYLQLVPVGTGMLFLSNDSGWFHDNVIAGNHTLGFAGTDQGVLNSLNDPDPFSPTSPDMLPVDNYVMRNAFSGNGGSPDASFTAFASDTLAVLSAGATGNCQSGNTGIATDVGLLALPVCPGARPPGCPYIPLPTTTTTTTSTTTTSSTLAPTFTNVYTTILSPRCASCHPTVYAALDLSTQSIAHSDLLTTATEASMPYVTPGDATLSYLQHKVDGTQASVGGSGSQMPLFSGPLSTAERNLIRAWINAGALND